VATPPPRRRRTPVVLIAVAAIVIIAAAAVAVVLVRSRSTTTTTGGSETTSASPNITDAQPGSAPNSFVITWSDSGDPTGPHTVYAFGENFENATHATSSPTTAQLPEAGGACFVLVRGAGDERSSPRCVDGGDPSLVNMDELKS
jgi:hypothetical protein